MWKPLKLIIAIMDKTAWKYQRQSLSFLFPLLNFTLISVYICTTIKYSGYLFFWLAKLNSFFGKMQIYEWFSLDNCRKGCVFMLEKCRTPYWKEKYHITLRISLYFNQRICMYGNKVKWFFLLVGQKMCYCLWKSIKNHHISTADKHFLSKNGTSE